MNRNVESHFAELPRVDLPRSIFDCSHGHKTSFNVGQVIPFFLDMDVLPGSTYKMSTSCVVRLQTPLTPIMDNMYLDTYYFAVPYRILWEHWINFMGESDHAWLPTVTYSVPQITSPSGGWNVGSIADYLGIPPGVDNLEVNALPFRAYASVCDSWFRDQNLTDPLLINTGDSTVAGTNGSGLADVAKGGVPFLAAKYHDYFTSCLPAPQKGPAVSLLGNAEAHVITSSSNPLATTIGSKVPMKGYYTSGSNTSSINRVTFGTGYNTASQNLTTTTTDSNTTGFVPSNLFADLGTADLNINDLRLAFAMQKFYERSARSGSRYRETLLAHFGCHSPDARMMIPEYLGGHRFPLSIHQVANTSESASSNLGDLGAMSNTTDIHDDFIYSSKEHCIIIGVCVVRYDHSYPQGIGKGWFRKNLFDFYWPELANVGEMPVYKREICALGTPQDDSVFGYQEAWAEYRYRPSRVSGEMRPGIANSLATWHLSDYYLTQPTLSDAWIREDKANVDRVLAVTSATSNQVFADFYFNLKVTAPMPVFSIPGLIDHH